MSGPFYLAETVKSKDEDSHYHATKGEKLSLLCLAVGVATVVGAFIIGGLTYGIYIAATKGNTDPLVYGPSIAGFYGALAGGLFFMIVSIAVAGFHALMKHRRVGTYVLQKQ